MKDGFDAFVECGILANGFLRLRCGDCGHDKQVWLKPGDKLVTRIEKLGALEFALT